jgi:hydrogenase maturation factor HypF (carbamoyltransferase family)
MQSRAMQYDFSTSDLIVKAMGKTDQIAEIFSSELKNIKSKKYARILGVYWHHIENKAEKTQRGGEIYEMQKQSWQLINQLSPFPVLCDKEYFLYPPKSTLSIMWPENPGKVWLRKRFEENDLKGIVQELETTDCKSTSIYDLCNATLGLLNGKQHIKNIHDSLNKLQALAQSAKDLRHLPYCLGIKNDFFDGAYLLQKIDRDKKNQEFVGNLALRFYQTLAQWLYYIASQQETQAIIAVGSVFNQKILVEMIEKILPENIALFVVPEVHSQPLKLQL